MSTEPRWWQSGVIYQIYPRSFMDSDGDGVGDLEGILQRLDYLNDGTEASLGVDAIWLSPIHPSPQADFGYDISDYRDVDPIFGDLDVFSRLVEACHERGMKVILDLVVNHTSDQHSWFKASRSSKDDPRREWYIWRDGRGGGPPNNWASTFGGPAWTRDPATGQYYYHAFLPSQPDLNWRNREVQDEIMDTMRFWMDRGVDGFRLDVFNCYLKDAGFRDNPRRLHPGGLFYGYLGQRHVHDRDQDGMHDILARMRMTVEDWPDRVLVGETLDEDSWYQRATDYCRHLGRGLHMVFNFRLLRSSWRAGPLSRAVRAWHDGMPDEGWPTWVFSNHDFPRHLSRYDQGGMGEERARLAAIMLVTLRGTPFLYYGEEIGMREGRIPRQLIQDPPGKRFWPFYRGRDGCRTPMQWDGSENTGFSKGRPWLPVNPDHRELSVEAQSRDPRSLLSAYRQLIWLRKQSPALSAGEMVFPEEDHPQILTWLRMSDGSPSVRVVLNLSARSAQLPRPPGEDGYLVLHCTHVEWDVGAGEPLSLRPLEGLVLEVQR